ncbi:hypothetical protein O7622_11280 [Micromonospora sp. WMMD1076]|uniref:hypothetical protein n=1 Tax=Micromonospora sp. WMMD1076 TaxID=3016103 RepID=UPI00249CAF5A|nr:hypothetical protein [Micromonospora sp. WMMD1076]WFF09092.1 hypothetical protein O7622_11280 [Micromonospora sp. WMMD1076]
MSADIPARDPRIEIRYTDDDPTPRPTEVHEPEPFEVDCPHLRHQLGTPAAWLPTKGHALLTQLAMPISLALGRPVAALGLAEDQGPLICCCADLNVRQALDAGAIVAVPATEYDTRQVLTLLELPPGAKVDVNCAVINSPGEPSVFVLGISLGTMRVLATLATLREVTDGGDND